MKKENKALARQRKAEAKKKAALKKKLIIIGSIVLAVVLVVAVVVGVKIANDAANAPVTRQFSKYVTKEGKIKGIDIKEAVSLCNLEEVLQFKAEDIEPGEEDILVAMESALSSAETLNTEEGIELQDGDKISLDYVGSVDGVEFEGGNTNGNGATLTLGSGSYIDDFEDQLVGHKVGENVTVEVTFPETYSNNPDLAGKDAVFEVVINGVYQIEITDELVAEKIEGCATVEEYKEQVRQSLYDQNLSSAIWNVISGKSEILEMPEKYTNAILEMNAYVYQYEYAMMNEQVYSTYGYYGWESMEDYFLQYYGMTVEELEEYIQYYTSVDVTFAMLCQAIYEERGLTLTEDHKLTFVENMGYTADTMETAIDAYGANYITQGAMSIAVDEYVESLAVVTE